MKRSIVILLGLTLFVLFSVPTLAANADKGKTLTATCVACHAGDGNSLAGSFPKLAGQGEKYLLKQMLDMQTGARSAPLMIGQLDRFSAQDLEDIAAFYAAQTPSIGTAEKSKVALGESIYRGGIKRKQIAACSSCHSPAGDGMALASFPALAGQWPEYTVTQLKAFRDGERTNDGDGMMMQGVSLDLSDKEMEAVASYLFGLSK